MYHLVPLLLALPLCVTLLGLPLQGRSFVYAANCCLSGSSVSVVNQVLETQEPGIPVIGSGVTVAISPDGRTVFAATQSPSAILAIDAVTRAIFATVAIGGIPVALATSPDGSVLYVARCALSGDRGCVAGSVDVISTANFTLTSTIPVPQGTPQGISLNTTGTQAYVTTGNVKPLGATGIATIDTALNSVSVFLPVAQALLGRILVLPVGTDGFVADLQLPFVHRINLSTGQIVENIRVKDTPTGMALNPDGSILYVADQDLTAISTISNSILFHSYVTVISAGLTIAPDGSKCYIADFFGSTLDTFDFNLQSVTARVPTGFRPLAAVVTNDGTTTFVANGGSSTVSQIDEATNVVVAQAEAGSEPEDIKISPDGRYVYAVNAYSSNVSVLSTAPFERVMNIPTGYLPTASVLSPDGTRLYVNTYGATITVIDTVARAVIGNIATAPDGSTLAYGMAISNNGKTLYALTSYRSFNGILIIDTATQAVVQRIPVIGDIAEIALGTLDEFGYISGNTNQSFLVVVDLSSRKQVDSIFAFEPFGVKVAPRGKYLYTGTTDHTSINVIDRETGRTVSNTPVAGNVAIALNAAGTKLYATGPCVSVFDTTTSSVAATIITGGLSFGLDAQ